MKIYQVDVFTNIPFEGNPAAICILEKEYNDSVLQNYLHSQILRWI